MTPRLAAPLLVGALLAAAAAGGAYLRYMKRAMNKFGDEAKAAFGAATLTVDGVSTPLGQGAFVVLDANTTHKVTPVDNSPVTVLVHHHKGGGQ